jgi:iron complex outermembrane recepter protein
MLARSSINSLFALSLLSGAASTASAADGFPQSVTNAAPKVLPKLVITGKAEDRAAYAVTDAATATKTDTPIILTPVSIQVIPQQVLKDQQITRLGDALNNVSGVIHNNDSYGTGDSFSIRGFDQMEVTYENGVKLDQYTTSGLTRSLANIEQIEVIKGPASVLYGRAEPGGLVNVVTKMPLDTPYYSLDQQAGSYDFYRTTLDATAPLNAGKTLLYRFNLDYENSGSFREFVYAHRLFLFPTLQWKTDDRNRVTLEIKYGAGTEVFDNGIPFLANGTPANVPLSRNFVEPDANHSTSHEYSAKLSASHDFDENWKLRVLYKAEYHSSPSPNSQYYSGDADANGDLQRYWYVTDHFHHLTHQAVVDLTGKFETFGISHTAIAGFDYYHQQGYYDIGQPSASVPTINIYNPLYGQAFPSLDPASGGFEKSGQDAFGAYLQDQMELPGNVHLLAGFRYDQATTFEHGTFFTADTRDTPPITPRFGILWQAVKPVSLYATYTENFGATPLGNTPAPGKLLPPESARQYEFGIKTEWLDQRLTVTASVYQLTKQNVPTADPSNPAYSVAIGEARSRGFELDVAGRITAGWRVIGGYSYIDCVTTQDNNTPSLAGLRFPDAPYNSASLWSTYEVQGGATRGLRFGAGVVYRDGEVNYESPPPYTSYSVDRIPSYTVVNAMVSYTWHCGKTKIGAQLNVNNLFDRAYFASVNPGQAQPGQPHSLLGSLRLEF